MTVAQLSYRFSKRHGVLARSNAQGECELLYVSQPDVTVLSECRRVLQQPFTLKAISSEEFQTQLAQQFQQSDSSQRLAADVTQDLDLADIAANLPTSEDLLDSHNEAPIIRLLNAVLREAINQQATDIHIETFAHEVLVRLRIDGVLTTALTLDRKLAPLVISRIKVMAKLDIAEKRLPQDGRLALQIAGHTVDVRVSTLPAKHAERVVMRLLDKSSAKLDLDVLGMDPQSRTQVNKLLQHVHGIILVTGPTGSGKTTTLCAMLNALNEPTRNILTVEDPIEYELTGIGQTQVNSKIDMTFAKGLRAILRQDPDIVMVGEIRDTETAEIAVQASLTGHLVLSTLHTNTAIGATTRLLDMGIEPFLLASSLQGIIAQRLVRTLCDECKVARQVSDAESELMHCQAEQTIYEPRGCQACAQTGYRGRTGIYEIIVVDDALRSLIHDGGTEQAMIQLARQQTQSILAAGFARVCQGQTSLAEVLRVTSEER